MSVRVTSVREVLSAAHRAFKRGESDTVFHATQSNGRKNAWIRLQTGDLLGEGDALPDPSPDRSLHLTMFEKGPVNDYILMVQCSNNPEAVASVPARLPGNDVYDIILYAADVLDCPDGFAPQLVCRGVPLETTAALEKSVIDDGETEFVLVPVL